VKVSELTGEKLDCWVAKADGKEVCPKEHITSLIHPEYCFEHKKPICERYSSDWSQGGPIIERTGISISRIAIRDSPVIWQADFNYRYERGEAPLVAAMRCFVASKFGDEVE
jgi:hypothetical protein